MIREARPTQADVSEAGNVRETFADAVHDLGGLDVLAHPAAIQRSALPEEVTADDGDLRLAFNVRGTMLTNQAAFEHRRDSGGSQASVR